MAGNFPPASGAGFGAQELPPKKSHLGVIVLEKPLYLANVYPNLDSGGSFSRLCSPGFLAQHPGSCWSSLPPRCFQQYEPSPVPSHAQDICLLLPPTMSKCVFFFNSSHQQQCFYPKHNKSEKPRKIASIGT